MKLYNRFTVNNAKLLSTVNYQLSTKKMALFETALHKVLAHEGGYVNDPLTHRIYKYLFLANGGIRRWEPTVLSLRKIAIPTFLILRIFSPINNLVF